MSPLHHPLHLPLPDHQGGEGLEEARPDCPPHVHRQEIDIGQHPHPQNTDSYNKPYKTEIEKLRFYFCKQHQNDKEDISVINTQELK